MQIDLDTLNDLLSHCGCCNHPTCCPPQIECHSGATNLQDSLFEKPLDDSDSSIPDFERTRYKRIKRTWEGVPFEREELFSESSPPGAPYVDVSRVVESLECDWVWTYINQYTNSFRTETSPDFFRICDLQASIPMITCEVTGGYTYTQKDRVIAPGGIGAFYDSYVETAATENVSGEETEDHAAWITLYGSEEGWQAARDEWQEASNAHSAWLLNPVGPEPEVPGEPFNEPEEFYGPCTFKTTKTGTYTDWDEENGIHVRPSTEEAPNPEISVSFNDDGPDFRGRPAPAPPLIYEDPVSYFEWLAEVDAWHESVANFDHRDSSESEFADCQYGFECSAFKAVNAYQPGWSAQYQWFRYRFKLNKCCVWENIRSEWDEVFYPREWLEWLRWIESSDFPQPEEPAARPEKTERVWVWTGTPPRCDDSTSDSAVLNPYDYEPMWSPWSAVVKMPTGLAGQGIIVNRNYMQKCYAAPPEKMPGIFGIYAESDSTPQPF